MDDVTRNNNDAPQGGFDFEAKRAWMNAVVRDRALKPFTIIILQNIARIYVKHTGPVHERGLLFPHQAVIAKRLNIDERQIRRAFADAKNRYLVLDRPRKRGTSEPDRWRLVMPEVQDNLSGTSEAEVQDNLAEVQDNLAEVQDNLAEVQDNLSGTTRRNAAGDTPCGGSHVGKEVGKEGGKEEKNAPPEPSKNGFPALAALAQTDPPPAPLAHGNPFRGTPREAFWLALNAKYVLAEKPINHTWSIDDSPLGGFPPITWQEFVHDYGGIPYVRPQFCDKHPTGTDDDCHGCGRQKKLGKKWDTALLEWKTTIDKSIQDIKGCKFCRDSDGKYTNQEGLWWCEHPGSLPDAHGRNYNWKSVESTDSARYAH